MMETGKRNLLRSLPAVDAVLRDPAGETLAGRHGRAAATAAVREALEDLRREISAGERPEVSEGAVASAASRLLSGRGLRRVVNATGVILTPTSVARSSRSGLWPPSPRPRPRYSNLEYDLPSGVAARATTTRCRSSRS
jgi:L-seryl-tRNA(Ser) seleniumtransferase